MNTIRRIRTDDDLEAALKRIDEIFDAPEGSPEEDELDILSTLVERYEDEHYPILPVSPIAAIEFMMEQRDLKRRDLVPFIGSASKVSEVLSGKRDITMSMARSLNKHLGIPADILLQDPHASLDDDLQLEWERFPLREMAKRQWIDAGPDLKGRAEEIMRSLLQRAGGPTFAPNALFRMNSLARVNARADRYALTAWCWQVMAQANESRPTADYHADTVTPAFLRNIAKLSRYGDGPRMAHGALAERGIALQIVRHLPKTYLDGAAIWIGNGRPVIGLTLRHDRIDNFWFTLLHELAHLGRHLDGKESTVFCDDLTLRDPRTDSRVSADKEAEADAWAEDALIPPDNGQEGLSFRTVPSPTDVQELAQRHEVHPAIIAGRVRYTQQNYRLLSQFVGGGAIRKQFETAARRSTER